MNIQHATFKIRRLHRGFTLIELLIVIAIIGILSTVLMVNFIGIRERARDARRKSDLRQIQQALELYKADVGDYPGTISCGGQIINGSTVYMTKVPADPSTGCYGYEKPGEGNPPAPYTLYACLENTSDSDTHNIHDSGKCGSGGWTFEISSDQ
jgi:type II secretion system protein G